MDPILALARERGLAVLEDACQAHGALYRGRPVGTLAGERGIGALSFYPTKNLGALGDGGAILRERPRPRRPAPPAPQRRPERPLPPRGRRASTAASTRCRRPSCAWGSATSPRGPRGAAPSAAFYPRELGGAGVALPGEQPYARAVFHLFVVRHPRRDALAGRAAGAGRRDAHPLPDPAPPAARLRRPGREAGRPARWPRRPRREILSLPLYPELTRRAGAGGGRGRARRPLKRL